MLTVLLRIPQAAPNKMYKVNDDNDNQTNQSCLFSLFDKYLKSYNNYLPLQAYLEFLESNELDRFESIANSKTNTTSNQPQPLRRTDIASSLNLIKNSTSSQLILAQKVYKLAITIDYSCHTSNLQLIRKSLEKTFEKLEQEYENFSDNCLKLEPQVDLTVLLWNPLFKHDQLNVYTLQPALPFVLLIYSKRLVKSNLSTMPNYILLKLNQSKCLVNDTIKPEREKNNFSPATVTINQMLNNKGRALNSFELHVAFIVKMFSYLTVNTATNASYISNFPVQHHIHITDGILYTSDLIKTLDRISKSSISFSFICTGISNRPDSNVSSSFGHVTDHFLMKFIACISNGFYGITDENLEYKLIYCQPLFYFCNINSTITDIQVCIFYALYSVFKKFSI